MDQRSRGGVCVLAVTAVGALLGGCGLGAESGSKPIATPTTTTERTTAVILPQNDSPTGTARSGEQAGDAGDPPECGAEHASAVITEIDRGQGTFAVVLTNHGPGPCVLSGAGNLRMFAVDGRELDLNVLRDGNSGEPFSVDPDRQATMPVRYATLPDAEAVACETGGRYLRITLPGDDTVVARSRTEQELPPVCGNVVADNWEAGD